MAFGKIDEHFLRMSHSEGAKSPLQHTKRGAIIAKGNKILGIGVSAHLEQGKSAVQLPSDEKYIATVRAEIAALGACVRNGISLVGATIYISTQPDWSSFKSIVVFGIKRIVFSGPNTSDRIKHYANLMGVELLSIG
jgi:deoxycytidylate deaminase